MMAAQETMNTELPNLHYLNKFIKLKCAPYLLDMKIFPNAKEITESMAMYEAVRKTISPKSELGNTKNTVFVVGDGHRPRTAALFAFLSNWQCHSIDPNLSQHDSILSIGRLFIHRVTIRDFLPDKPACYLNSLSVVLLPHAHVDMQDIAYIFPNIDILVAMPCCEPYNSQQKMFNGKPPDTEYADFGVHSPDRIVKIWNINRK
jgi:hypothetical protein